MPIAFALVILIMVAVSLQNSAMLRTSRSTEDTLQSIIEAQKKEIIALRELRTAYEREAAALRRTVAIYAEMQR